MIRGAALFVALFVSTPDAFAEEAASARGTFVERARTASVAETPPAALTPRERAERFIDGLDAQTSRAELEAAFVALDRPVQLEVLELWKARMPPTGRSQRTRERLATLAAGREPALPRLATTARAERRDAEVSTAVAPPPEVGLAVAEYFVSLICLIGWQVAGRVILPEPTKDNAPLLLLADGLISSLVTGGIVYGVASSSDYYEPSFYGPVIGAALTYAAGVGLAASQADSTADVNEVGAILLATIAAIPAVATTVANATKVPRSPAYTSSRPTRPDEILAARGVEHDRPLVFTLLSGRF